MVLFVDYRMIMIIEASLADQRLRHAHGTASEDGTDDGAMSALVSMPSVPERELATHAEFPRSLPCPRCCSTISLSTVSWCHCLSKAPSVICPSCRSCFCTLTAYPKRAEWMSAIRELLERQSNEVVHRVPRAVAAIAVGRPVVLVVDDGEDTRLIIEHEVEQMGYHVITAAGGEEALALIEETRPDVVLTDALMPEIDGRLLCRMIKAIDPSIKVVIVTGIYKNWRYRVESMSTFGADEHLAKPLDFARLEEILGRFTAKAEAP